MARPLGEIVNHRRAFNETDQHPEAIVEMQTRSRLCLKAVDDALADKEFIIGDFCAADIMLGYSLMLCERLAPSDEYQRASAYWNRLQQRPACGVAIKTK